MFTERIYIIKCACVCVCNERIKRGPLAVAGPDVCGPCDLLATRDLKMLHTKYIHGLGGGEGGGSRRDARPQPDGDGVVGGSGGLRGSSCMRAV